jgi:excisionase family DNA binding protein
MSGSLPTIPPTSATLSPGVSEAEKMLRQHERVEITVNGVQVQLPPDLEAAVYQEYKRVAPALPPEMTTNQAADFLDVSRPFVIKLIQRGELPFRQEGRHRHIPTAALLAY